MPTPKNSRTAIRRYLAGFSAVAAGSFCLYYAFATGKPTPLRIEGPSNAQQQASRQEELLRARIRDAPGDSVARLELIRLLQDQKRHADARDAAEEAAVAIPDDADIRTSLADARAATGRIEEAIKGLQGSAAPTTGQQLQLAELQLQAGRRQAAVHLIQSLRRLEAPHKLVAGQLLLDAGKPTAAAALLKPAANSSGDVRNYYGFALLLSGKYDQAAEVLLPAAHQGAQVPTLQFYAGSALRLSGKVDRLPQSVAHLAKATELAPFEPFFHYELSLARAQLRDWVGARTAMEQAAKLAPDSPEIQRDLARIYARDKQDAPAALARARYFRLLDDASGAVQELEPWVKRTPQDIDLGLALSVALHEAGRFPEAVKLVDRLHQLEPQNPQVLWSQFRLRRALKQNDRALVTLAELEKLTGADVVIADERATTLQRLARYAEAEQILQDLCRREPENAERHYNLGVSLGLWSQQPNAQAAAEVSYRKAIAIRSTYAEAHQALGKLLLTSGRTSEAIAHLRQALDLAPSFPDALRALGRAYVAAGDKARSEDAFALFRQLEVRQKEREQKELPVRQLRDVHRSRTALYEFYVRAGDEKSAIRELEIVTHAFPGDHAAHSLLEVLYGHARRFQRQYEEREWLRQHGGVTGGLSK